MTVADRPRFRIGDIEPEYRFPLVEKATGQRTEEHEVIDGDPVVQELGEKPTQITVRGQAYLDEVQQLDDLTEGEELEMRSHRHSGPVIVRDVSSSPRQEIGGKRSDITNPDNRQYDYTLELTAE